MILQQVLQDVPKEIDNKQFETNIVYKISKKELIEGTSGGVVCLACRRLVKVALESAQLHLFA